MRLPIFAWIALVSIVMSAALASCGGSDYSNATATSGLTPGSGGGALPTAQTTAGRQAAQELCASVAQFRSALGVLSESRTTADLKSAAQLTVDAAERLKQAAAQSRVSGADRLQQALDNFESSITTATSSDQPLGQSIAVVGTAVTDVQISLQAVAASGGCD